MVTTRTGDAAVAERLYPPMPSFGWRGWLGPLIVTAIAAVIRLVHLGRPNAVSFDETYYPKDAWALLRFGVEHKAVENHKDLMLSAGDNWRTVEAFTSEGSFVVHPPFGKWTIAAGEYLFGVSPFGWRIAVANDLEIAHLFDTICQVAIGLSPPAVISNYSSLDDCVGAIW